MLYIHILDRITYIIFSLSCIQTIERTKILIWNLLNKCYAYIGNVLFMVWQSSTFVHYTSYKDNILHDAGLGLFIFKWIHYFIFYEPKKNMNFNIKHNYKHNPKMLVSRYSKEFILRITFILLELAWHSVCYEKRFYF